MVFKPHVDLAERSVLTVRSKPQKCVSVLANSLECVGSYMKNRDEVVSLQRLDGLSPVGIRSSGKRNTKRRTTKQETNEINEWEQHSRDQCGRRNANVMDLASIRRSAEELCRCLKSEQPVG